MNQELLAFIQVGGLLVAVTSAVVAYRKSKPEAGKLDAETGLIRVEAQAKVIDSLTREIQRQDKEIADLRLQLAHERQDFEARFRSLKEEMRNELDGLARSPDPNTNPKE